MRRSVRRSAPCSLSVSASVKKRHFCAIYIYIYDDFTKTGSGQTSGKLKKSGVSLEAFDCYIALFYLAFVCYRLASPVIFSIFLCRTVDDVSYLVADFTLTCDDASWRLAVAWSALWTAGYVLGFPALMLVALRRRWAEVDFVAKHYVDDEGEQRGWSKCWEVVILAMPLCLTCLINVFPKGTRERIAIAVLLSGGFLLLHVRYQPFRHSAHNHLETVAYSALTLTYFIGLLMQSDAAPQSQYHAFDAILLLLTAVVVLSAVAVAVIGARAGYHVLREDEEAKEEARRRRAGGSGGGERGGGRLVANKRGLRWTMNGSSLSFSLTNLLLSISLLRCR